MAFHRPPFLDPELADGQVSALGRRLIGVVAGVFVAVLALECFLQTMPTAGALYRELPTETRPYTVWQQGPDQLFSVGWSFRGANKIHINAQGFNSSGDYGLPPFGIVIGDSFMEGFMIPENDRYALRLAAMFKTPDRIQTYAVSGYSLADYLFVAEAVATQRHPEFVVINVHDSDVRESIFPNPGFYFRNNEGKFEITPELNPTALTRVAKISALLRYAFLNLHLPPAQAFKRSESEIGLSPPLSESKLTVQKEKEKEKEMATLFVNRLANLQKETGVRVLLQFDTDRASIMEDRPIVPPMDPLLEMEKQAEEAGLGVLDLTETFSNDWKTNRLPLDFSPEDRHWTPRVQGLAAKAAYEKLRQLGIKNP